MTNYVVVWKVQTSIGPRREATRCLTWQRAERFIAIAEEKGVTIEMVIFE